MGVGPQTTEIDALVYMWAGSFCDFLQYGVISWNGTRYAYSYYGWLIESHRRSIEHCSCTTSFCWTEKCKKNTNAWQLCAATLKRSARRWRKREESSIVPDAKTRCLGRPLIFHVTQAMMSHGLVTTTMTASGLYLTSSGTMPLKIPTFFCTRSRRVSPSFWRAPAVMMITREFCSHSIKPTKNSYKKLYNSS